MDMDHGEFLKLQKQMEDHFDGRYRKINDCDDKVMAEEGKIEELRIGFNDLKVEQAKTNTLLKVLIAVLSAIGTAVLGVCIKLLFN